MFTAHCNLKVVKLFDDCPNPLLWSSRNFIQSECMHAVLTAAAVMCHVDNCVLSGGGEQFIWGSRLAMRRTITNWQLPYAFPDLQGSAKRWSPGCVNAAGKAWQKG